MNYRRKKRADILLRLSDFFSAFASFAALSPGDAAKTVRRLAGTGEYGALGFLMPFAARSRDANVRTVWREEVAAFDGYSLFDREERELLFSFPECFGMTTLEKFTQTCERYSEIFAERYERARADIAKNGTVTLGAGILSAALILIMFL